MESLYDVLQHMDVVAYPLYETYKPSSRDRGDMQLNASKLIILGCYTIIEWQHFMQWNNQSRFLAVNTSRYIRCTPYQKCVITFIIWRVTSIASRATFTSRASLI
jgi:hypothetical protein